MNVLAGWFTGYLYPLNHSLKPRPARRVDPGPSRLGPGTGPGVGKNPIGRWPGETWSTRQDSGHPVKPG
jgi:hypothetical protein